jgi:RNA-binding protein YhbY
VPDVTARQRARLAWPTLVQVIGRALVLYRPHPEAPTIVLPD